MGLTGPKTAVRGNRIAAVGMAVAVIATFLIAGIGNWGLIVLGIVIGHGRRRARRAQREDDRDAADGRAVQRRRRRRGRPDRLGRVPPDDGFSGEPTYIAIFSLFAAIIGSVSFWGSNIAFAKLQELHPGPADHDRPRPAVREPRAAR